MVDPGTYYVMAGEISAPSYYPGVNALSSAKSVLVAAGARVSGIDFKTAVPLTYVISGRVALLPGQKFSQGSRIALAGPASQEQPVKPDGSFEFARLLSGSYTLRLIPEAFVFEMPVVIEDRNLTGLAYPNSPMVSVSGSVAMEDASAAPTVSLSFGDAKQNRVMEVATRQSFSFFAPEGEFRAGVKGVPDGYQVKSLTAGNVDLLNNSLKLSAAEPLTTIALTLKAVPTREGREARIALPELRQLSVRLGVESNVPAAARPIVTLRFEGNGTITPVVIDGSSGETPLRFALRQGPYRVSASVRESAAGTSSVQVKTLMAGSVDLLKSPLEVSADSSKEIVVSIGR
jgi:hypothetical protein